MRPISLAFALAFQVGTAKAVLAQPVCTPTVSGDLRVDKFESRTFSTSITVRTWLPPGYSDSAQQDVTYPTLYMFDGQTLFDECTAFKGEHEVRLDETVSTLIRERRVAPMIIVGIDSTGRRSHEYSAYKNPITGASVPEPIGRQLPVFMAEELLPWVKARYRVTSNAAETGIGGMSLGAAAALYVTLQRPDLFRLALLQSPSLLLGNGQFLRDTTSLARAPDRIVLAVGGKEFDFPDIDSYFAPLGLTRAAAETGIVKMTEALAANLRGAYMKRSEVMLVVDDGRHDSASWSRRMPDAVAFLFGKQ